MIIQSFFQAMHLTAKRQERASEQLRRNFVLKNLMWLYRNNKGIKVFEMHFITTQLNGFRQVV
jgi:hypothetical protein